ncbi:hypothetical protein [Mycobacterium saskatchewanense]|nr:hypothetical protein [Mycobacterium saskatchewanense]
MHPRFGERQRRRIERGSRGFRSPAGGYFSAMLWLAVVLAVVGAGLFVVGWVAYANGAGVAPQRRTKDDPTGIKRAGSRVAWSDVFRGMPRIAGVMLDKEASRDDRLTALGSLCVLAAVVAGVGAVVALLAALA